MKHSQPHDPLGQNDEENEIAGEELEEVTDTDEIQSAEESAMNIDNESAREATGELTSDQEVDPELAVEAALVEAADERKHKNRESTSEKAKKSAAERVAKGLSAEPVSKKILDPNRLRGKKYRATLALVEKGKEYPIEEALELVKKTSLSSFDGAVEVHAKVGLENVRGTVVLPHGSGKSKKVAVADDETLEAIGNGKLDFDVLIATPAQMPKLAKFAKILGPKGLMPSPKAGTVTEDVEAVKKEIEQGRVEYRADKNGVVHLSIGRVSFLPEQLLENYKVVEAALTSSKMSRLSLAATMGLGIRVALTK